MVFLFLLCLSFILPLSEILSYEIDNKNNKKNTISLPSTIALYRYEWNITWGNSLNDEGDGIAIDGSGNVFIIGSTNNYGAGDIDVLLLKYHSNGTLLWNETWGGLIMRREME